jgi:hypothetical protein
MPIHRKSPPEQNHPWTRQDEENLLHEIAEDQRLRSLGIDPDGDSVDIMIKLHQLAETYTLRNPLKTPSQ